MTANQIAFYKARNEAEHYRRMDSENQRHNFASEALNAEDISVKDWANRENARLGFTNAAINKQHYAQSDFNNQVSNQIKTDQLLLDYANTFGQPVNAGQIGIADYYTFDPKKGKDAYVRFDTSNVGKYSYVTPQAIESYGKALGSLFKGVETMYKVTKND